MLVDLDPSDGAPDPLYLAALKHATTGPEIAFRDVLVFHRHCMHGGLDLAFAVEGDAAPFLAAYRALGLSEAAGIVEATASLFAAKIRWPWWRRRFETLNRRYVALALAGREAGPDLIEAAAIRFAQAHASDFDAVTSAAARGDYNAIDFNRLLAEPDDSN